MNVHTILAVLGAVQAMRRAALLAAAEGEADGSLSAEDMDAIRERADAADARWDDAVSEARRELEGGS